MIHRVLLAIAASVTVFIAANVTAGATEFQLAQAQLAQTQLAQAAAAPEADEAIHMQLRAMRAAVEAGFNTGDVEAIIAHLHDSVVFTTMNSDTVKGPQGVRDYFSAMMEGPDKVVEEISISFEADDLTTLYRGDTGIAVGNSKAHYRLASGMEFDVEARWTATIVRENQDWLIAAFHYSTNMFDNPVLTKLKNTGLWYGAGGGLLLLLAGLALGMRLRTRKA